MIISSNFLIISIYRSMAYIAYFVQKLHWCMWILMFLKTWPF